MMLEFWSALTTYELSWLDCLLVLSVMLVAGISKAGIKGISIIVVIVMAFVFGSKASTGILMPVLVVADVVAVWYYRRHTEWRYLRQLLPWMVVGVLAGVVVGKDLPEAVFKKWMAGLIFLSVLILFWWEQRRVKTVPQQWWFAGLIGTIAGFTTMIGNLAGPFANIFFLALRLPKNAFIGTAAWMFLLINLFKLPFHILVWRTIDTATLSLNLVLLPAVGLGFLLGLRLVSAIREEHYRLLILLLTGLGALLLLR